MPDGTLTGALPAPLPPQARAGLFGKLPARGDFIREDLPRDFVDAWDGWWQRGLADTQRMAREDWRAAWLEAPVWRFVLPPGLCGRHGVLGLWMPSVDKAGRFFPLTIAATADADWAPLVGAMGAFLAAAEQAGRDALEFDLAPAELLARVQAAFMPGDPASDIPNCEQDQTSWWTEGGTRVGACHRTGAVLPEGQAFAGLLDDGWAAPAEEKRYYRKSCWSLWVARSKLRLPLHPAEGTHHGHGAIHKVACQHRSFGRYTAPACISGLGIG